MRKLLTGILCTALLFQHSLIVHGEEAETTESEYQIETIPVSGISITPSSLSIYVGEGAQLNAVITPSDASNQNVTWRSSNTAIAAVDGNGYVSGVSAGSATIIAMSEDGGYFDACQVTVTAKAERFSSESYSIWLKPGETKQIEYTLYPENSVGEVKWSYGWGYQDLVTIDENGTVRTNEGTGYAVIYGRLENGFEQNYQIYVAEDPSSFSVENHSMKMGLGSSRQIRLDVSDWKAQYCRKHIESSDPEIVSVSEEWTGETYFGINARSEGTATITVTADNGVSISFSVEVLQGKFASSITAVESSVWLKPHEEKQLEYTLYPEDAEDEVEWKLSYANGNCITLKDGGVVKAGSNCNDAYVYAYIYNGNSADFHIYVAEDPGTITANKQTVRMLKGNSRGINLSVSPYEAQYCRKHIVSSNPDIVQISEEWIGNNYLYIYALETGTSQITITADNGVSTVIEVEVLEGNYADSITAVERDVWLKPGESKQLEFTLNPENAEDDVEWSLSWNQTSSVIDLSANGLVTAKNTGEEHVRASILNGNSTDYSIHVYQDPASFSVDGNNYVIASNSSRGIYLNVSPNSAQYCRKHIVSSNPEIVSVSQEWTANTYLDLNTHQSGRATITVTADNGVSVSFEVEVIEGIANSIQMTNGNSTDYIWLDPGKSRKLQYRLSPSTATEIPVFTSTDDNIVYVDKNGVATARAASGTAVINASIRNGQSVNYFVSINENPTKLLFGQSEYFVPIGESASVEVNLEPLSIKKTHIEWSSSNPEIASFSEGNSNTSRSKTLNCRKEGTAVITATADNGVKAEATVHVIRGYAYAISADQEQIYLDLGETLDLPYTLSAYTDDTSLETITWEVLSGDDVVSLNDKGNVTAKAYGQAVVAASISSLYRNYSERNIGYYYWGPERVLFTVNVGRQPGSLHFPHDSYEINVGDNLRLYALSDSADTEFVKKTYTSSDPSILRITSSYEPEVEAVAIKPGTVTITATAENGAVASAIVTVREGKPDFNNSCLDFQWLKCLCISEQYDLRTAYSNEYNLYDPENKWISNDEAVATVDGGIVTAVGNGVAVIDIVNPDGLILRTWFIAVNQPESIHFSQDEYYFPAGMYIYWHSLLQAEPSDQMFDAVIKSDDDSIVQISLPENGAQYGSTLKKGTVTLTAETPSGLKAECVVHVGSPVAGQNLVLAEKAPVTVHAGCSRIPDIRVLPEYSDPGAYTLISSDPDIVSITEGTNYSDYPMFYARPRILGVKPGTATITAKLKENPEESITFEVTVVDGISEYGEYKHVLYQLDDKRNKAANLGYADEYTCFIGERYFLLSYFLQGDRNGQEGVSTDLQAYYRGYAVIEDTNNCIIESRDGIGAASGPTAFFTTMNRFNFIAVHPGTVILKTIGGRTVKINVVDPDSAVSVYGNSLALEGKIGVNYYLEIPEDEVKSTDIKLSFNGTDTTIHAADAAVRTVNSKKMRFVTVYVSAKEMRDPILLDTYDSSGRKKTLLNREGKDITETGYVYSVAAYFEKAQASSDEKLRKLAAAMDTYGRYAQIYFNYHTDQFSGMEDVSSVTADTVKKYRALSAGSVDGLNYLGGSLELSSDTSVRVYFTLEDGHSINEYTFRVNGDEFEASSKGNGQYFLAMDNIAAQDLHKAISFTAEKDDDVIMINYYPLSYAYSALTSEKAKEAIRNTCRALYLYNQAAITYFNSK